MLFVMFLWRWAARCQSCWRTLSPATHLGRPYQLPLQPSAATTIGRLCGLSISSHGGCTGQSVQALLVVRLAAVCRAPSRMTHATLCCNAPPSRAGVGTVPQYLCRPNNMFTVCVRPGHVFANARAAALMVLRCVALRLCFT